MSGTKGTKTDAGKYYGRDWTGRLHEVGDVDRPPDVVICRRVADYAPSRVPAAAALTDCTRCGARIAFNPFGAHQDRPKICLQCGGIAPLPTES